MESIIFFSHRIKKQVAAILTFNSVHYIDADDNCITIDRDSCWHCNADGLDRAVNYFEDPRFERWLNKK